MKDTSQNPFYLLDLGLLPPTTQKRRKKKQKLYRNMTKQAHSIKGEKTEKIVKEQTKQTPRTFNL